ncbi:tRNA (adenosine(37)-N6)-threonylcarbamoyltransferase complex dimerization subunit type 1 TsaB [Candidatus Saccharibacteria bacterium]|nr:tRNA (adenosine(37)-N6)-threonylcarbamoyltransferase complex dimerization subunit type 1 TsaB [Candidatus Saccharibacteria bacterium]
MLILTVRTDKPEAEVGLFNNEKELAYKKWQAHKQLSETIHKKIDSLLEQQSSEWGDIAGVVAYSGPGSFTGLRIGISLVNALGESQGIPIVGATGDNWINQGLEKLKLGKNDKIIIPDYGRPARTTSPRK